MYSTVDRCIRKPVTKARMDPEDKYGTGSFVFIEDDNLEKDLNNACEKGDIQKVRTLMQRLARPLNSLKLTHKPPLFWACKAGQYTTVVTLVEEFNCDPHYVSERGHTLVHVSCARGHVDVTRYLAKQHSVDPNKPNKDGTTPLLSACNNGHTQMILVLIDELKCNPHALGENRKTLLHIACRNGHMDIVKLLVKKYKLDPNAVDAFRETPLHIACSKGHLEIVQYFVDELKCPVEVFDRYSTSPLHNACRNGQVDIVKHLVDKHKCNMMVYDKSGYMPFHVACRYGRKNVIELLLDRNFNPNTPTLTNEVPIQIVRDKDTTTVLIQRGASTEGADLDILRQFQVQQPLDSLVHVLVIGHEGAGKSTIVKALKVIRSNDFMTRIFGSNVILECSQVRTQGIVPFHLHSQEFGNLMIYDFAGQYDYHPSHAAVLEHSNTSSAPLFLLVVNLTESLEVNKRRINYWVNFVENNPIPGGQHPHAIVIASHRDALKILYPKEHQAKISALEGFTLSRFKSSGITLDGFFAFDCREISAKHTQFRKQLSQTCDRLRSNIEVDVSCHVLMVVLLKEFEGKVSCTIEEVSKKVEQSDYPLSTKAERLCQLAEALSSRTEILFIRHKLHPHKSWILLQMNVFLTEIHGRIYAPKTFPKSLEASETGVIRWSQIRECFSDFPDPNLVVAFLGYFEECKVIDDPAVLVLIDEDVARDTAACVSQPSVELPSIRPSSTASPITSLEKRFPCTDDTLESPYCQGRFPMIVTPPSSIDIGEDSVPDGSPSSVKGSFTPRVTQVGRTEQYNCDDEVKADRVSLPKPLEPIHTSPKRPTQPASPSGFSHDNKYLFIPGLISADYPSASVWKGREGYTLFSGWCLQCAEKRFFEPRFLQALQLRLTFGFAVAKSNKDKDKGPSSRPSSLLPSKRECTLWKNGLRWLSIDGIEVIVEFIEDHTGILLLMRAKELSKMKCIKLRSQLIQKIIEAKNDYCPTLETSETLIHPKHIEESRQYPVISKPLNSLTRYDVISIAEAFLTGSHYVFDTAREGHIDISDLVYFDSYNGVNRALVSRLYKQEDQCKEVTQDLIQDFSFCHRNCSQLKDALLSEHPRFWDKKPNSSMDVLKWYQETKPLYMATFKSDLDLYSLFCGRNILEVETSMVPVAELTGKHSLGH